MSRPVTISKGRGQRWSRREFLATVGAAGLAFAVPQVEGLEAERATVTDRLAPHLVYIGCFAAVASDAGYIDCFHVERNQWTHVGRTPSASPRALAVHPTLPILYAAHSTSAHLGLPRGSVSAYRIDMASGDLTAVSQQPLSLSAVYPRHLAVSPDGRLLMVCSAAGGAYNLFSLNADGTLRHIPYALKQTGSGPHPMQATAQPRASIFHPNGHTLYACDFGADRVDQITLADGVPSVVKRHALPPGSGPAHLAMHPSGTMLLVGSRLQSAVSVLPLDGSGEISGAISTTAFEAKGGGPIAISPMGDRVFVAGAAGRDVASVEVLSLSRHTLHLSPEMTLRMKCQSPIRQLAFAENQLVLVGPGGISSAKITDQGSSSADESVARTDNAQSLAIFRFERRDVPGLAS